MRRSQGGRWPLPIAARAAPRWAGAAAHRCLIPAAGGCLPLPSCPATCHLTGPRAAKGRPAPTPRRASYAATPFCSTSNTSKVRGVAQNGGDLAGRLPTPGAAAAATAASGPNHHSLPALALQEFAASVASTASTSNALQNMWRRWVAAAGSHLHSTRCIELATASRCCQLPLRPSLCACDLPWQ